MSYSTPVDYCRFGADMKKATQLWWTVDPKLYSFNALQCQGRDVCMAIICGKHGREWKDIPLVERYSIPMLLSMQIAQAMLVFFAGHPKVLYADYAESCLATAHQVAEHKILIRKAATFRRDARQIAVGAKRQRGAAGEYDGRRVEKLFRKRRTGEMGPLQRNGYLAGI